jgi:hypothetical protein
LLWDLATLVVAKLLLAAVEVFLGVVVASLQAALHPDPPQPQMLLLRLLLHDLEGLPLTEELLQLVLAVVAVGRWPLC